MENRQNTYGMQTGLGGIASPQSAANTASAAPAPDQETFAGLLLRMEQLAKKAYSVSGHARDIRSHICGGFPETSEKPGGPQAVASGFIEHTHSILAEIETALRAADDTLEYTWSRISL